MPTTTTLRSSVSKGAGSGRRRTFGMPFTIEKHRSGRLTPHASKDRQGIGRHQMSATATTAGSGLDKYFKVRDRGSSVPREVRGGLATFFTMAYIIVLNPIILGSGVDKF